jgi:hypothetical protein
MIGFYVNLIVNHKSMTVEEVPPRWREDVRKKLIDMNYILPDGSINPAY